MLTSDTESSGTARRALARARARLVRELNVPLGTNDLTGISRASQWARRVLVAVAIIALPFLQSVSWSTRLTLMAAAVAFEVLCEISDRINRSHPGFPALFVNAYLGLVFIFAAVIIAPVLHGVGLFAFALTAAFFPAVGGLRAYIPMTCTAAGLALVAEAHVPEGMRFSALTMTAFVVFTVVLGLMVEGMVRELRRTSTQLGRLRTAVGAVSALPELAPTLDSMVDSIAEIFGAQTTGILLREDDHLFVAAPSGATDEFAGDRVIEYTRRELAERDKSPLAYAMTHNEVVVVERIPDARFPEWSRVWAGPLAGFGFGSIVAAPLRAAGEPFGVLNLCFVKSGAMSEVDLELLEVYAEQASLVILRAQAYEREKIAAERIQDADHLKSEFLAMVSHELRTPLTSVKGWVDTVLLRWDRFDDDRRQQLLKRASTNADELTRLVDQLLDFSRIEAGRVELRPQVLPLRAAIEGITNDLRPALGEREVIIDVEGGVAVADVNAFNHILVNLLTNAVKFSPADSAITVAVEERVDDLVVSVTDEGCGIPPEDLERIFERFYQSAGPQLSRRGTGIGLAIVRRFVELHGGEVWVESTVDEGSTFFFSLPSAGPDAGAGAATSCAS